MPPLTSSALCVCFSIPCYFIPSQFSGASSTDKPYAVTVTLKTKLNLGIQGRMQVQLNKSLSCLHSWRCARIDLTENGFHSRVTLQPQATWVTSPALIMRGLGSLRPCVRKFNSLVKAFHIMCIHRSKSCTAGIRMRHLRVVNFISTVEMAVCTVISVSMIQG